MQRVNASVGRANLPIHHVGGILLRPLERLRYVGDERVELLLGGLELLDLVLEPLLFAGVFDVAVVPELTTYSMSVRA